MRLESALYASREGLQVHGQGISVIGDNVANTSTVGFKRSRLEFADLFSDGETQKSTTPIGQTIGSGVKAGTIRQIFEPGTIEATGRATDVAIDGNGFFMVGEATAPQYSRAGNLSINQSGLLVNADGLPLIGYQGASTTLSTLNMASISGTGSPTSALTIYGNLDARSGAKTAPAAPTSFADLSSQATYTTVADVYDSLGTSHSVTLAFTKTDVNTWTAQAYVNGGELAGGTAGVPTLVGSTTLSFGADGTIATANRAAATIAATPAWGNGAAAGAFNINLGQWNQFSAGSIPTSITQDGQGVGNISSYRFDTDGSIFATLDSGGEALVGKIALADFQNRDALQRNGSLLFSPGENAGDAVIGTPNSGSFGQLRGAALERSTVDIANEFVDLVVMQRGYQANSQTFSTTSQLLRDTIGLIR